MRRQTAAPQHQDFQGEVGQAHQAETPYPSPQIAQALLIPIRGHQALTYCQLYCDFFVK